ncbi:hypothetical protein RKD44_007790 [Streptomyces collinus]
MRAMLRGVPLAVLCVVGLAACSGSDGGAPETGLSAQQMRRAMPTVDSLPAGWRGQAAPEVTEGKKALPKCLAITPKCGSAKLVAMGVDTYHEGTVNRPEGDPEPTADVYVLSFDSVAGARSIMRSALTKSANDEEPERPLKLDGVDAQETKAWCQGAPGDYASGVTMRVGKVVVHVRAKGLKAIDDTEPLAKLLVDRVRKAK